MNRNIFANIAEQLKASSKESARALPGSKGGETPKQLQTYRTEAYSYFTEITETRLLYSAENWVRLKLTLRTAGPVVHGPSAELDPVLSGRGILMATNEEFEVYLPKGGRWYVSSETINRISVVVEPVPWLEQMAMEALSSAGAIKQAVLYAGSVVADAVNALRSRASGSGAGVKASEPLRCPPNPTPLTLPPGTSLPKIRR